MPNGGVQPIGDAAVVGAGTTGQGIALSLALGGFVVFFADTSPEKLSHALDDIGGSLGTLLERANVDESAARIALEHIRPTGTIGRAMNQVGFAVEAVPEDLALKRNVLAELDRHCPDRAVLASTTSSFELSQLASSTGRPDRVVLTRWGDPPHLTSRVDVLIGPETSYATVDWTRRVLQYIGKKPVFISAHGDFDDPDQSRQRS